MVLGQEGPLQPGGKARPAAAAQIAGLDHVGKGCRGHLGQHLFERRIAAAGDIRRERMAVRLADVGQQDGFE